MASSEHMKIDEGEDLVLKHLKTIIHSTLKTIPAVLCVLIYSSVVTKLNYILQEYLYVTDAIS